MGLEGVQGKQKRVPLKKKPGGNEHVGRDTRGIQGSQKKSGGKIRGHRSIPKNLRGMRLKLKGIGGIDFSNFSVEFPGEKQNQGKSNDSS